MLQASRCRAYYLHNIMKPAHNNNCRNKSKFKKRQFKNADDDEQDDVNNSEYTVAIVDNPLYAENEGDIDEFFKTELEGEEEQRENEVNM